VSSNARNFPDVSSRVAASIWGIVNSQIDIKHDQKLAYLGNDSINTLLYGREGLWKSKEASRRITLLRLDRAENKRY
jgi:hypothetical protein